MICGHCGHQNDDETRCGHCGRRLDEARYRSASPGTLQRNAGGAMSSAPWRGELRRRLDAYRTRRDAAASQAARAASSASSTDDPNVVSIDRGADFPRPTPAAERLGLADEMKWREQRRNAAAFTANSLTTSAAPAPTPAAHDVSESRSFLPSRGGGARRHEEPVAADPAQVQSPAPARELRCAATVAPLRIRFLAGVLDAAVLIVSLGVFWGVFHELGGAISTDREGARAVGFTAFLVTGFYWAFHVGYFGHDARDDLGGVAPAEFPRSSRKRASARCPGFRPAVQHDHPRHRIRLGFSGRRRTDLARPHVEDVSQPRRSHRVPLPCRRGTPAPLIPADRRGPASKTRIRLTQPGERTR